jgi:mercuric ion binding protein
VTEATVDFEKKTATVKYDPDKVAPAQFIKATTEAGYPSTVRK